MKAILFILLFPVVAWPHHPVEAKFDPDRPVLLNGIVTGVDWSNPHVHILVNVLVNGALENWAIEVESPDVLERSGWGLDTLVPGDSISIEGLVARDGTDQAWATTIRRDGVRVLAVDPGVLTERLVARPGGETPRWPDGRPVLGAGPGVGGYWTAPDLPALVEDGVEVAMDALGVLANIDDAPKVAPFQTWSKDLYVLRQREYLEDDPAFLYCIPPGGPRHFQMPFPFGLQIVEDRARGRFFVLTGGGNSNWRLITLDEGGPAGPPPSDSLFYGVSRGEWNGDTLVVETGGFNESFWFSNGGLPHTRALQVTERISRPDLNTLNYAVTIDDPGAYTRPWTSSWTLQWLPGEDPPEHFCQENRP